MGMFTSISHNGDEIQIKTGLDMCNTYTAGDVADDYMPDGTYRGIRVQAHSEKHRWWWVVIDKRVIQTPFLAKKGETPEHAEERYLRREK